MQLLYSVCRGDTEQNEPSSSRKRTGTGYPRNWARVWSKYYCTLELGTTSLHRTFHNVLKYQVFLIHFNFRPLHKGLVSVIQGFHCNTSWLLPLCRIMLHTSPVASRLWAWKSSMRSFLRSALYTGYARSSWIKWKSCYRTIGQFLSQELSTALLRALLSHLPHTLLPALCLCNRSLSNSKLQGTHLLHPCLLTQHPTEQCPHLITRPIHSLLQLIPLTPIRVLLDRLPTLGIGSINILDIDVVLLRFMFVTMIFFYEPCCSFIIVLNEIHGLSWIQFLVNTVVVLYLEY